MLKTGITHSTAQQVVPLTGYSYYTERGGSGWDLTGSAQLSQGGGQADLRGSRLEPQWRETRLVYRPGLLHVDLQTAKKVSELYVWPATGYMQLRSDSRTGPLFCCVSAVMTICWFEIQARARLLVPESASFSLARFPALRCPAFSWFSTSEAEVDISSAMFEFRGRVF